MFEFTIGKGTNEFWFRLIEPKTKQGCTHIIAYEDYAGTGERNSLCGAVSYARGALDVADIHGFDKDYGELPMCTNCTKALSKKYGFSLMAIMVSISNSIAKLGSKIAVPENEVDVSSVYFHAVVRKEATKWELAPMKFTSLEDAKKDIKDTLEVYNCDKVLVLKAVLLTKLECSTVISVKDISFDMGIVKE